MKIADYTRYPEAFKKFGINFTEEPGWRERGHGDIVKVQFIVIHHTAGGNDAGDIRIVTYGRSDLPGPLSQLVLKRNGDPHIVAQGVAWHAGYGPAMWGAPAGNGNYYSIGIEGVSNGYNDWTEAQRANYPKVVAALLKDMGLPSDRWIFHRDYNKRDGKIDPAGFDAGWFGREVNRWYNDGGQPVESAIQAKRRENAWLGNKTIPEDERKTLDGVGRYASYDNGYVYWHPSIGARTIKNGPIWDYYAAQKWEQGFLGYPINDTHDLGDGRSAQAFQNGSVYSGPKGTYLVMGQIGAEWARLNWEKGPLGMPISEELKSPAGIIQKYENGTIFYTVAGGARATYGLIEQTRSRLDQEFSFGYPENSELPCFNNTGRFNHFVKASIYWKRGTETAFAVADPAREIWGKMGWEQGRLGYPISTTSPKFGSLEIRRTDFEGGSIEYNTKTGEITLIISGKVVDLPK